jgi:hypothetical protein
MVRRFLTDPRARAMVVKWPEIAGAHFDAAAEITLNELRVELTYPLDQTTDDFFRDPDRLGSPMGRLVTREVCRRYGG